MSGFQAVGLFLVSLLFTIIIFTLWFRMAFRYLRISAVNPLSQIVFKLTNPILLPLHKLFKLSYKPSLRYDWMAFLVLIFVEFIKITLISFIAFKAMMPVLYLLIYVAADLIIQPCDLLFYLIIIEVVLSWINPHLQHPVLSVIKTINAPFLKFGQLIVPNISGFDFSPFVILIILKVLTLFLRFSLPVNLI